MGAQHNIGPTWHVRTEISIVHAVLKQAVNIRPEPDSGRWAKAMDLVAPAGFNLNGDGALVCALICIRDGSSHLARIVMRARFGVAPAHMLQELREEVAQVGIQARDRAAMAWMLLNTLLGDGSLKS